MMGFLKRRRVVGLSLGGASSVAVLANRGKRGGEARLLRVAEAPAISFRAAPPDDLDDIVKSLAVKLGREARRADTPASIALPDPLFSEDRFSFAEAPDKPDALNALIKWRIAREHRLDAEDIAASAQRLPGQSETGEAQFLVRFAPRATIEAVEVAARRAGLTPVLIEAQSRFNIAAEPAIAATADVTLSGQWWSLTYRDAATPEGHVRADWRIGGVSDLAGPLARLIRTMARAETGLTVTVNAAAAEATDMVAALSSRLTEKSKVLAADLPDDRALALTAATA